MIHIGELAMNTNSFGRERRIYFIAHPASALKLRPTQILGLVLELRL